MILGARGEEALRVVLSVGFAGMEVADGYRGSAGEEFGGVAVEFDGRRRSGSGGEESFWTLAVTREVRREMMAGLGRGCIEAF